MVTVRRLSAFSYSLWPSREAWHRALFLRTEIGDHWRIDTPDRIFDPASDAFDTAWSRALRCRSHGFCNWRDGLEPVTDGLARVIPLLRRAYPGREAEICDLEELIREAVAIKARPILAGTPIESQS